MKVEYDVAIIGGAFSGAATALMLKRKLPAARVLIIEKTTEFDRKVGESTTEVSSCYMTRILGLTHYLGHHQLGKQGLRMWFSKSPDQPFDDCVEVGSAYQARIPGYQVDRSKLDSHMLNLAVAAGCDLWRPAKVTKVELTEPWADGDRGRRAERADARAAGWWTRAGGPRCWPGSSAIFALTTNIRSMPSGHGSNVKQWDDYERSQRFPKMLGGIFTSREWATNHLLGRGWWVWIIPLQGGDVSAGVVYDSRIFKLPEGNSLGERLHSHILGTRSAARSLARRE